MSNRGNKIRALGVAALAAPLLLGTASPALAATPPAGAYAESYGLLVDTDLLAGNVPLKVGPEAPVASSCPPGGTKSAQLIDVPADPLAHADVITDTATTACAPASGKAVSNIVNVDALMGQPVAIHADAITATSTTNCTAKPGGSTKVLNLSIAGSDVPIPADPPANFEPWQPILAPLGLRIIINEQHPAATGRGFVVNGLHIIAAEEGAALPVGGQVIRGRSFAGVAAAPSAAAAAAAAPLPPLPALPALCCDATRLLRTELAAVAAADAPNDKPPPPPLPVLAPPMPGMPSECCPD